MIILTFIFSLYIKISIFTFILFIIAATLTRLGFGETDVFKVMNDFNENLNKIENEKYRNYITNIVNNCIASPINLLMYELIFSFTPILNIFFMIAYIKDIFNKLTYKKDDINE